MPLGILFVWDRRKAAANVRKHDVSFEDAAQILGILFFSPFRIPSIAEREERFFSIGQSWAHRLIAVSHQESRNKIRIISARKATRREARRYAEGEVD